MSSKSEGKKEVVHPEFAARFTTLLESLELNPRQFALRIQSNPQNISNYMLGYALPGGTILKQIADRWPKVNINWLIAGVGEPFISELQGKAKLPADPAPAAIEASPLAVVADADEVKRLKEDNRWLREQLALWQKIATSGVDLSKLASTGTDGSFNADARLAAEFIEQRPLMWIHGQEPAAEEKAA